MRKRRLLGSDGSKQGVFWGHCERFPPGGCKTIPCFGFSRVWDGFSLDLLFLLLPMSPPCPLTANHESCAACRSERVMGAWSMDGCESHWSSSIGSGAEIRIWVRGKPPAEFPELMVGIGTDEVAEVSRMVAGSYCAMSSRVLSSFLWRETGFSGRQRTWKR